MTLSYWDLQVYLLYHNYPKRFGKMINYMLNLIICIQCLH